MGLPKCLVVRCLFLLSVCIGTSSWSPDSFALDPEPKSYMKELGVKQVEQKLLEFELFVQNAGGAPVEGAKVKPWALRSSQGHGVWQANEGTGKTEPETVTTDATGKATISYPKYANVSEHIVTTAVTVSVDHADHPYVSHEDVTVPTEKTHTMSLPVGAAVEVAITIDGKPAADDAVAAVTTGGRGWMKPGLDTSRTASGDYRIPPMAKGTAEFMLLKLDDDRPTHFSAIETVEIQGGEGTIKRVVELLPAARIRGKLSDNVPRPIKQGRVKIETIPNGYDGVTWFDWAEVDGDGTFAIEGWPATEPIQLIALCDGFIAKSGERPPMVDPKHDRSNLQRAQVFMEPSESELVVEMTPLVDCRVKVVNGFGKSVQGAMVAAGPNIFWWNSGSQIYGWPLVSAGQLLLTGKYEREDGEGIHAQPFKGTTDDEGNVTIQLPAGRRTLWAGSKRYQLPIKMGRRRHRIEVAAGEPIDLKLTLQPIGLDVLGDWEDLCGFVFG